MALYRGKYILPDLDKITPEMEKDLDLAYDICEVYREEFPCEMCGRCCHQANIIVRPEEVERVAAAGQVPLYDFMTQWVYRTEDGRILFNKEPDAPCRFLGKDRKCTIWQDRPEICDDFPYLVSMFMSRVYLAIVNPQVDILRMIAYMDDTWPCTREIKASIVDRVAAARKQRAARLSAGA